MEAVEVETKMQKRIAAAAAAENVVVDIEEDFGIAVAAVVFVIDLRQKLASWMSSHRLWLLGRICWRSFGIRSHRRRRRFDDVLDVVSGWHFDCHHFVDFVPDIVHHADYDNTGYCL